MRSENDGREALKGTVNAAKEIADRTDGTPRQTVEISGQDGAAVQVGARLSATYLIRALRDIYGLSSDPPKKSVAADPPQHHPS
jgi:hypothetical protein